MAIIMTGKSGFNGNLSFILGILAIGICISLFGLSMSRAYSDSGNKQSGWTYVQEFRYFNVVFYTLIILFLGKCSTAPATSKKGLFTTVAFYCYIVFAFIEASHSTWFLMKRIPDLEVAKGLRYWDNSEIGFVRSVSAIEVKEGRKVVFAGRNTNYATFMHLNGFSSADYLDNLVGKPLKASERTTLFVRVDETDKIKYSNFLKANMAYSIGSFKGYEYFRIRLN